MRARQSVLRPWKDRPRVDHAQLSCGLALRLLHGFPKGRRNQLCLSFESFLASF